MKRFNWPDDLENTYGTRANGFDYPRRPTCTHGRDRRPVQYDLAEGLNVWGGPEPKRHWNTTGTIVVSLLEYYTQNPDVRYAISNYGTPPIDCAQFDYLITGLIQKAQEGKTIYVHCFGGHGRTGLVFGCMAARLGIDDPVEHVRSNYCRRAIETTSQEIFVTDFQ